MSTKGAREEEREQPKKEDVGREWEDITNLRRTKEATQLENSRSGLGAQWSLGSVRSHCWQPLFIIRRRLGSPNVTKISIVGSAWSDGPRYLAPKKPPHKCTSHNPFRRRLQSLHPSSHHRPGPNTQTLRLYQLLSLGGKCTGTTEPLSESVRNSTTQAQWEGHVTTRGWPIHDDESWVDKVSRVNP